MKNQQRLPSKREVFATSTTNAAPQTAEGGPGEIEMALSRLHETLESVATMLDSLGNRLAPVRAMRPSAAPEPSQDASCQMAAAINTATGRAESLAAHLREIHETLRLS